MKGHIAVVYAYAGGQSWVNVFGAREVIEQG